MVREPPDPGAADTAPHRDGWCRRDRLAAARGGCDSTRAPNPGAYECHPGRGAAPARTVGSSQRGSTRAAGICRPTLSTCELPVAEQSSRAGAVTGEGVIHQSGRRVSRGCNRPPTEVLADGCIGHRDPDFSDEHRRGSGGARRARLVLSAQGAVGERRLRDPQRQPRPGALRSIRRRVCVASIVSERATQLLGCGAALRGRGVGRVRGPGHGLIVAGGVAASRRSRTRPLVSRCVPSLRALPLEEACELRIRPGRWRSLAPGKESEAKRSLACLAAMLQLGVLGGFPPVAREAADVRGGARARVAGENTMLRDAQLRSFAPGARVPVIRQDVEQLAPGGSAGPLGPGFVDVGRVVIGMGSARVAGHVGVGDRPVFRRGAGDRLYCVREVSMTVGAP